MIEEVLRVYIHENECFSGKYCSSNYKKHRKRVMISVSFFWVTRTIRHDCCIYYFRIIYKIRLICAFVR